MDPRPDGLIDDIHCVILCGGQSRRMGEDKTFVPLMGRTLLDHVYQSVRTVFRNIMISVHDSNVTYRHQLKQVIDHYEIRSPLSGIHAALKSIGKGRVLVVAVDMPLVRPEIFRLICDFDPIADVVVPRVQGYLEPLLALYSTNCIVPIEKSIERGDRKVVSFYPDVEVREVEQAALEKVDPKLRTFINVNSKAGLRAIELLANIAEVS